MTKRHQAKGDDGLVYDVFEEASHSGQSDVHGRNVYALRPSSWKLVDGRFLKEVDWRTLRTSDGSLTLTLLKPTIPSARR